MRAHEDNGERGKNQKTGVMTHVYLGHYSATRLLRQFNHNE